MCSERFIAANTASDILYEFANTFIAPSKGTIIRRIQMRKSEKNLCIYRASNPDPSVIQPLV
jgi:hypothetical protein